MAHLDNTAVIDKTPATIRSYCQRCKATRLLHCQLIYVQGDHNVVKTTCLTCSKTITK